VGTHATGQLDLYCNKRSFYFLEEFRIPAGSVREGQELVKRVSSVAEFQSFCVREFNLSSCDLRLTLGCAPLCGLILVSVYHNTGG
jgi:hypothetical protein